MANYDRMAGATLADRQFEELRQAELYDAHNGETIEAGRDDFAFYLPLILAADSVLDVGCGTGALLGLARAGGHRGRLTGIDPAAGMLTIARERTDIEWIQGTVEETDLEETFDLVVMSGHAFQVLVTDEELTTAIGAISRALKPGGMFAFETRNPAARAWERWTPEHPWHFIVDGQPGTYTAEVEGPIKGGVVSFGSWYHRSDWSAAEYSRSTLRFLEASELADHLGQNDLCIEAQFGDWDRSPLEAASPEIITLARKPEAIRPRG